jgi:hypothetical protein
MAKTFLGLRPSSEPKSVQDLYDYPEDAYVERVHFSTGSRQAADKVIHVITYNGAPSTNFNNAPLGSRFFDYETGESHIKTAATTWTKT